MLQIRYAGTPAAIITDPANGCWAKATFGDESEEFHGYEAKALAVVWLGRRLLPDSTHYAA